MSRSTGTTELQSAFAWPTPDLVQLGTVVKEIASSWTPDGHLYAQHTRIQDGWTTRTTYNGFDEWMPALAGETGSVWVIVNQARPERKLSVSWNPEDARLEVTVAGDADIAMADLQSVCQAFITALSLKPWVRKGTGQLGDARRYFLRKEATLDWYGEAIELLLAFVVRADGFWGRLASRHGEILSERGYGSLDPWRVALTEALDNKEAERSYLSLQGPERRVTFDLDHIRDLLVLDVQSTSGRSG